MFEAATHLGSSSPAPVPSKSKQARGAVGPASGPEASTAGWHQVSSSWSSCSGVAWHVPATAMVDVLVVVEAVEVEMGVVGVVDVVVGGGGAGSASVSVAARRLASGVERRVSRDERSRSKRVRSSCMVTR